MEERIRQLIDYYKISVRQFEQKISVSDGLIHKALARKSELKSDTIAKILDIFPQVNPDWLLSGKGEMFRKDGETTASQPNQKLQTLPLIPFEALAGIPSIDNFGISFADCEQYVIPEFAARGVDFLIRVSGSSMYPKYSNGDILACTMIRDILFFQWGKVYVIDSSQGVLVKRIFESTTKDCIRLVSDNGEHYPPFDFPKSDIRSLALVSGVIRLE